MTSQDPLDEAFARLIEHQPAGFERVLAQRDTLSRSYRANRRAYLADKRAMRRRVRKISKRARATQQAERICGHRLDADSLFIQLVHLSRYAKKTGGCAIPDDRQSSFWPFFSI